MLIFRFNIKNFCKTAYSDYFIDKTVRITNRNPPVIILIAFLILFVFIDFSGHTLIYLLIAAMGSLVAAIKSIWNILISHFCSKVRLHPTLTDSLPTKS